jgi:hypothetical protein
MRLDVLDECSTLVPFGLGISRRSIVIQEPDIPAEPTRHKANIAGVGWLRTLFRHVKARSDSGTREAAY